MLKRFLIAIGYVHLLVASLATVDATSLKDDFLLSEKERLDKLPN